MASILVDHPTATGGWDVLTVIVTGPCASLVGGQTRHVQILEKVAARLGYRLIHVEIGRRPGENGALASVRRLLADYLRFARIVRRHRAVRAAPCLVHLNSSVQFASLLRELGFLVCARIVSRSPILVQFHGSLLVDANDRRWLLRGLARLVATAANRLVVLSRHQAASIGGAAAVNARVAPNVVELHPIDERRPPDEAQVRLLYVGRLSEEKGLALCAAAVARLRERGHAVHLTVAGEGEFRDGFAALVTRLGLSDQVQLLGPVSADRVRELLLSHDLLLFASLIPEGLPYVLLEAMEAALPVVATVTSRSMAELVENAGGAILAVRPDAEAFVSAVEGLARNAGDRKRMGECGRAAATRHYSFEAAVDDWRAAWGGPPANRDRSSLRPGPETPG